ncbi:MAG: ribonuclease P protein component [Planctomycetaceae bacterium]|nr:ribonuclease P protein component [Planctomycetaceae bacterium]
MRTMDQRFGRQFRVKRGAEFSRAIEQGRLVSDALTRLYALANGRQYSRIGVAVGSRHGGAVRRNYVKRLCREAFRLSRADLPFGWDFIIMPHARKRPTLVALQASLIKLAAQATRSQGDPVEGPEK